jgi:hypothetical protein
MKNAENINALLKDQVYITVFNMCADWHKQEKILVPKSAKVSILKEICEMNITDIGYVESIMRSRDSDVASILIRFDIMYSNVVMRIGADAIKKMQEDFMYLIQQLTPPVKKPKRGADKKLKKQIEECPWLILLPFLNRLHVAETVTTD